MSKKIGDVKNASFPMDDRGRTYHLGVKRGEVANRVISVGDPNRARLLADLLDDPENTFCRSSNRGFTIFTGHFDGVPVSVIATGMGMPMMDFVVRESRAIVDGSMCYIRLGTCGTPYSRVNVGTVVVADAGSVQLLRNPDAFLEDESETAPEPYIFSKIACADKELTGLVIEKLTKEVGEEYVTTGLNVTADTFFASQGRQDSRFDDRSENILSTIQERYPNCSSVEMETFHLFHLAQCSKPKQSIRVAAACIAVANRETDEFISNDLLRAQEHKAGKAVLSAACALPLASVMSTDECVWVTGVQEEFRYSTAYESSSPRRKRKALFSTNEEMIKTA